MKIIFFTYHIAGAPRKATIPLFAENFASLGHDVRIVTVGYSALTRLKGDPRHAYGQTVPTNQWFDISPKIKGYLPFTWLNAGRLPTSFLNKLSSPFFRFYAGRLPHLVAQQAQDADVIAIESGPGLLYIPALRRLCPKARFVYMASDRLSTLRVHPVISDALRAYEKDFNLIWIPAKVLQQDFANPHCLYIPQGVETDLMDKTSPNPYTTNKNIVSVGDMLFDENTVTHLAQSHTDWQIHLFGKKARCAANLPNIITHGETPFDQVVPYIQHATLGLAPYRPAPDADYLSQSSLKLRQYAYACLPTLAPSFAASDYPNIFGYNPQNLLTLDDAFDKAIHCNRTLFTKEHILSWKDVTKKLCDAIIAA